MFEAMPDTLDPVSKEKERKGREKGVVVRYLLPSLMT